MQGRRKWLALAILPVLLIAGDFFYWRLALRQLNDRFEAWTRHAQSLGWDIRHGKITAEGWPDRATLRVHNVSLATSDSGLAPITIGSWHLASVAWSSDVLLVSIGLTRPGVVDVTPVRVGPLRLNAAPAMPMAADHLHLRLALRADGSLRSADVEATSLALEVPNRGRFGVGEFAAHADLRPGRGRDQPVASFEVTAGPIALPTARRWSLGPVIGQFALEGGLNGPWSTSPETGWGAAAKAWRDDGGSLQLQRLAIEWGPVRLDASATIALDEDLQPMGAGSGKIVGYDAAFDAMEAGAVLSRSAATAAKAVLSLLANAPAGGEPEEVEVPLTLQFRTLSVRQVPLLRLPELDWPER